MNSLSITILMIPLVLSIGIASFYSIDIVPTAEALKSKGTSLPEVGSKKVCGDKLCSEISNMDKQRFEKTESSVFDHIIEISNSVNYEAMISQLEARIAELEAQVALYKEEQTTVQANIERFDYLDFVSFNEKDWEVFSELHHPDVLVGYSDGRMTMDMETHRPDVEFAFTWAPDIQITDHPITFGQGPWTAGTGVVEGTFTEPMILPDGTVIEPTGNKFKYTMVTIAKWEDGQITEEYLYWDNAEVARQIGIK